jgi:hypothetical protein
VRDVVLRSGVVVPLGSWCYRNGVIGSVETSVCKDWIVIQGHDWRVMESWDAKRGGLFERTENEV